MMKVVWVVITCYIVVNMCYVHFENDDEGNSDVNYRHNDENNDNL